MFPIFVTTYPYELKTLHEVADRPYGVMTTPAISGRVQQLFKDFPAKERWGDNGIFAGIRLSPLQLLAWYHSLNVTHGLILDIFKEKDATLEFAADMWKLYKQKQYSFELVGVAQGNTADEYIAAVKALVALGFESVAIGGLLVVQTITAKHTIRRINTVLVREILRLLNKEPMSCRLHWLGALSPLRNLPGSADSKGWCMDWINRPYSRSVTPEEARQRYLRETYFRQSLQLEMRLN